MKRKRRFKISNPFRFLTFLLISLVTTTTCVTQTVKLFATGEQKEDKQEAEVAEEVSSVTELDIAVPIEAKANTDLYKTTQSVLEGASFKETDLVNVGALADEKLLIKLSDVKWFKDEEKSSKQGLALFLNLNNVTDEELVVGRYIGDLIKPVLSYGDDTLKAHSQGMDSVVANTYGFTTLISNFQDYKLIQTSEYADVKTCDASITISAGESDTCYLVYDYAGLGDYELSFKVNEAVYANGVFTVKMDDSASSKESNK